MIWDVLNYPRFKLTSLPTPMVKATRLGKELNLELFIKRDDVMELLCGGNKVRKLEFLVADALAKGSDTLITRGATHSNSVAVTVAAARKANLDIIVVMTPPGDFKNIQGNLLFDTLMNAKFIYAQNTKEAKDMMSKIAEDLKSKGKKPYIVPGGGASEYGVLGYILATLEILEQVSQLKVKPKYIVHSTGTGTTQAGLVLGLKLLGAENIKVIGITDGTPSSEIKQLATSLYNSTAKMLKVNVTATENDFITYDEYGFGGYGSVSKEIVETITHVARTESIILDPVYTAKAMYGLIDLAHKGIIEKDSTVIFIHTGGLPVVFQYATEIVKNL
jgi:1-aminocyclopropane-1-carboxylate deaminase